MHVSMTKQQTILNPESRVKTDSRSSRRQGRAGACGFKRELSDIVAVADATFFSSVGNVTIGSGIDCSTAKM